MAHNHIRIDPTPGAAVPVAWDRTLTIPQDPFEYGVLVVPGLLAALCGLGVAALDIEHLVAAAHVVALPTPAGPPLLGVREPWLVTPIPRHVSQTLVDRHR